MTRPKVDKKIVIHAYKFNGWLYRTWEFPTVLEVTDDYICVSNQGSTILTNRIGSKRHFRSKVIQPSIWYFFKDEWFNLIYQKRENNIRVYINLASPYYYENGTLKYIDFDLDYVNRTFQKSHKLIKIDNNEFINNSKLLNYPNALKNKIINTSKMIEEKFNNHELDKYFNTKLLEKSGEEYNAKKRLLRTNTKTSRRFDK